MQDSGTGTTASRLQDLQQWLAPLGWIPWVAAAVLIALACVWAFWGRRGVKPVSHVQGVLFGLVLGALGGAMIEHVVTGGRPDFGVLLSEPPPCAPVRACWPAFLHVAFCVASRAGSGAVFSFSQPERPLAAGCFPLVFDCWGSRCGSPFPC